MDFLVKLEDLINKLICLLQEQLIRFIPRPIKRVYLKILRFNNTVLSFIKSLPHYFKVFVISLLGILKSPLSVDYKGKLLGSYQEAMEKYKKASPEAQVGKFKKAFMAPFLVLGQWMSGLSPTQSLVLLGFTALSFLSIVGLVSSGHRMAYDAFKADRAPASVEEVSFDRPQYYKKQTRFFDVTSIRLPVYFAQVNEIRSVDIDFTATLSNRKSKQLLEKLEFQFRDHLVLNLEPVVSYFPLEEEGKEIIRRKIQTELNEFLKLHKIEGEVVELKLTYVLAN